MTLRARVFASTFSLSILLLGAAAVGVSRLSSRQVDENLSSSAKAIERLSLLANEAERETPGLSEAFAEALSPLRKDLARRMVLERDAGLSLAVAWIGFFAIEAVVALIVALVASRYLTARWSRLRDGMLALRRGEPPARFFSGAHDEFGLVEQELDELVTALADREQARLELRALQGWGEAAAFLAHQARTPLASLSISARTARAALEPGREACAASLEALGRVEHEAERIASLFSRVRSLSGFKEPELAELDPADAFREAAATLAARGFSLSMDTITIVSDPSATRPRVDRAYLVEVFMNLLDNSLAASAEQGLPFRAVLRTEASLLGYRMVYSDGVVGLDPSIVSRVGSARFSTKPSGSGLGVWLVGRIAALHGGRLDVGLSASGGLVFTLTFPLAEARIG